MLHREARERTIVRASLFDRLIDEEPGRRTEERPLSTHNVEQLVESIEAEVTRVLNARNPLLAAPEGLERSVIDYGVNDFASLYTENEPARAELEAMLRTALETYEPRLARVQVEVQGEPLSQSMLEVRISGDLVATPVPAAISFKVQLENVRKA